MAEFTPNYNLKKPGQDDFYNIEDFNENADIIDAELKKLNDVIKDLGADGITLPDGKTISEKFDEIKTEIGSIEELDTDTKANVIAAINEIFQALASHKADYMQHTSYAIATGTNSYAVSIPGISSLVEGMSVKVKFTSANTGACTLNINGLGAIPIKKSNGNDLFAGNIKAGQILHLVYTGSVFQLLGEGGEYGTAQPEHVLVGYTIGTEEGIKSGTMPNRGAVTYTITTQGGSYTIPAGYHNGSGKVTANFANLVPENIRSGVNIGGIVGNMIDGSNMKKWASGRVTVTSAQKTFQYAGTTGTSSQSFVEVTGLAFTPKTIVIKMLDSFGRNNLTVYTEEISRIYPKEVITTVFNESYADLATRTYKADVYPAYVNAGFCLPLHMSSVTGMAEWVAIG